MPEPQSIFRQLSSILLTVQKQIIMATAFFCRDEEREFVRSCFATASTPSCRKGRVPPLSPRRLDILSIFSPAIVVLVLLDVLGCSSIPEPIEPDQKFQRRLDDLEKSARRYEEQQNWAGYARVQNDLGVIYRMQAELGIEPAQNLQRSLDALKEAARRQEEHLNWGGDAAVQNNLGLTYRMQAERDIEPVQNLQRSLDAFKEAARMEKELKNWVGYAKAQNHLGLTYQVLAQRGVEPEKNLRLATEAFKEASAH